MHGYNTTSHNSNTNSESYRQRGGEQENEIIELPKYVGYDICLSLVMCGVTRQVFYSIQRINHYDLGHCKVFLAVCGQGKIMRKNLEMKLTNKERKK